MTSEQRRGWTIVASLFTELMLVFGAGFFTAGIFFNPLLKQFGWSRARLASVTGALQATLGLSSPLFGWILDRVEARWLMAGGVALVGFGFVGASRIHSFTPLFLCYIAIGLGLGASSLLPASLVVANWFRERRGIAMGVTMAGTSVGGSLMTLAAHWAIGHGGWRFGYLLLAAPMFLVAIPVLLMNVKSHPPERVAVTTPGALPELPGMEIGPALGTRSFWMIFIIQFCFGYFAVAIVVHLPPYLIGLGYRSGIAALALSMVLVCASAGKLVMGTIADRVSGRIAVALDFAITAAGFVMFLGARSPAFLVASIPILGVVIGAPIALVPFLTAESLGLKRFGSIVGLTNLAYTLGAAIGPVLSGRIYDLTHSYAGAVMLFAMFALIGAAAALACSGLEEEQARLLKQAARVPG
jgi:MFS family permease